MVLNKGDQTLSYVLPDEVEKSGWRDGFSGEPVAANSEIKVAPHGVVVWLSDTAIEHPGLIAKLDQLMARKVIR